MKEMKEIVQVGQELYEYFSSELQTNEGVHVGTFVATLARLAGTSSLRSFNILPEKAEPGTVLLSNQANEEGPKLHGAIIGSLKMFGGLEIDQEKIVIKTPEMHKPKMEILETHRAYQDDFNRIASENGFDYQDAAFAGAVASAMAVSETRDQVDPYISVGIALYAVIEGLKTVPLPLEKNKEKKKSFFEVFRKSR